MADAQQAREALVAALRHEAPYAERDGYDVTARRMIDAADHIVALSARVASLTAERDTQAKAVQRADKVFAALIDFATVFLNDDPEGRIGVLSRRVVKHSVEARELIADAVLASGNPSESEPACKAESGALRSSTHESAAGEVHGE